MFSVSILTLGLFLLLAVGGAYIVNMLKFPVGSLIGSMTLVGFAKYLGFLDMDPTGSLSYVFQVLLGLMLGLSIKRISKSEINEKSIGL